MSVILLALILTVALPYSAYADDITASSVSWASLDAGNDMTAQILDSMFPMNGTTATTTGDMLAYFSAYVMLIAASWIGYSIIIQMHKTAESGKVFDSSFSGWVPIRAAAALIMMTPTTADGGYSLGQNMVMKAAKVSIGMARNLKDIVINDVGPKALPLAAPIIPGSRQIVQGVINSELCRALVNKASNNSDLVPAPSVSGNVGVVGHISVSYDMASGDSGSTPVCGQISMTTPGRVTAKLNATTIDFTEEGEMQVTALKQLIENIRPSVERIALTLWTTRDINTLKSLDSVFTTQTEYFSGQLNSIASSAVAKIRRAGSNEGEEDSGITLLKNLGWTGLGSYYLEIGRLNAEVQAISAITPTTQQPSWQGTGLYLQSDLAPFIQALNGYMAKQEDMLATSDQAYAPSSSPRMFENARISQDPHGVLDQVLRYMGISEATFSVIMNYMILPSAGTGWTDPLSSLLGLGHFLIDLALGIIGASAIASSATASFLTGAASLATGNVAGAAAGVAGVGLSGVVTALLTPIFTAAFLLLAPGVTLAFILPMTPCLFWYAGVTGWLVIVVEALVGVPIWFLAHLTFAGDGIHGKGIRGYEVMFTILFRPSMMVAGMILSYTIFSGMSWIWMKGFVVSSSFVFDHGYLLNNLIGILVLMGMCVTAEMTTATLSFRLISTLPHHLPDLAGFRSIGRVNSDDYVNKTEAPVKQGAEKSIGVAQRSLETGGNNSSHGTSEDDTNKNINVPQMDTTTEAQMSHMPIIKD